jgi:hypothetical protein
VNHKDLNRSNNKLSNLDKQMGFINSIHYNESIKGKRILNIRKRIIEPPPENAKTLKDYSDYLITRDGRVYSRHLKGYLTPGVQPTGYTVVSLNSGGIFVHQLVAKVYIPNPLNKKYVNHINCIKDDNRVENLEWVTCSENMQHANETLDFAYKVKINQLDIKTNKIIATFKSIKEAYLNTRVDQSSIVRVYKNKQGHAGGFKWALATDDDVLEPEKEKIKLGIRKKCLVI